MTHLISLNSHFNSLLSISLGILCGPLPGITNGDFNSANREYFKYETVVTYHCNLGERRQKLTDLMDELSIYCNSEDNQVGIWSRLPLQCIISNKCTPLAIENLIKMSENNGRESEWTPGVGDERGGLVCCDSWGHKESDTTEWLNWCPGYCK